MSLHPDVDRTAIPTTNGDKPERPVPRKTAMGLTSICLTVVVFCGTGSSAEFDPVSTGHDLVTMYCAGCHATELTGDSSLAQAPRFRDLHLRYDVEALSEALVEGIATAHPEMPQFEFEPDQAAAIVSYLKSLEMSWPVPVNGP